MKLQVKSSTLLILPCAIMWCTPQGLNLMFSQYTSVFNVSRCILWGVVLGMIILKGKKISKFCRELHLFWLVFLLCIMCADFTATNVNTWLIPFCSTCGFFLLIELFGLKNVTELFYRYFYAISVINLVLLFVMPQGFYFQLTAFDGYSSYDSFSNFISTDNTYAPFLMCFLLLGEICRDRYTNKTYIGMWVISVITAVRIWSATCLIGMAIYIGLIVLRKLRINFGKFKVWKIVIAFFIIFVFMYYFKIQNLFSVILVDLLGKDLTLTGRIGLWEKSIEMIGEKWIFGWGNHNNGAIILRDYYYWYAHNLVLDILLEGGVVTLGAFALLIHKMSRRLKGYLSLDVVSSCLRVMTIFMILSLTESYFNSVYFYMPIIIAVAVTNYARMGLNKNQFASS